MLTKIRFKNFKSFIKDTEISFEATRSEILNDSNVYNGVVKGAAFFGTNASGKTNTLNAITLLLDMLFKNFILNPTVVITKFNKEKTAYFEYTFKFNNDEIVYYFEINRNGQICKELLKLNNETLLNRLTNSAESFITENKDYNQNDIDERTLFLKAIYFNTKFVGFPVLIKWFDFLKSSVYVNPIRDAAKIVTFDRNTDEEIRLANYIEENGVEELNDFFKKYNFEYTIKYHKKNQNIEFIPFGSRLFFSRKGFEDIPLVLESYGNKVLLSILPTFLTLIKKGGILAIDEFSSGLHNLLEELLIQYFFENTKNSQIFFVSHSTNLLKTSLIRPDQLYSLDFNESGSFVRRFSDEKPRESQNLEKMYLSGVFGGIPQYAKNKYKL